VKETDSMHEAMKLGTDMQLAANNNYNVIGITTLEKIIE
jgi:hypothetical protein